MRWALGALIVVGASAIMIAAILRVRRRAPDGGYFNDGDRASGVFGVLATGFALLLGFVVFLAFTKYDESRAGAEAEALAVVQLFETAQLMPTDAGAKLAGEVECYGRSVVNLEWPAMETGRASETISPWGLSMFYTLQAVEPMTAAEQSAYDSWLAQTSAREEARLDRLHAAEGIVPLPMWIVLLLSAGLVLTYLLFYADSGERAMAQGMLAGGHRRDRGVAARPVVAEPSLRPGHRRDPTGCDATVLGLLGSARAALDLDQPLPCDASAQPL